jgi:multidrug efflux pump subunit AcrA (membrane-fusion protein)
MQYVNVVSPKQTDGERQHAAAGHLARLRRIADFRARDRLSAALVRRYRRAREAGPIARRSRHAGNRPGTRAGQSAARPDQLEPWPREKLATSAGSNCATRDAVSQQELDERQSTYTQDVANLAAADANVKRLRQLESFKRIVGAVRGVVTQRNVDVGDLIDAGSGTSRALFALAQSDPLRVYVQMPQAYCAERDQGRADGGPSRRPNCVGQKFQGHRSRAYRRRDRRADPLAADRSRAAQSRRQAACPAPMCRSRCRRRRTSGTDRCRAMRCCFAREGPQHRGGRREGQRRSGSKIVIAQDLGQIARNRKRHRAD